MKKQILMLTIVCCTLAGWTYNSAGQSDSAGPDEIAIREDLRVLRAIAEDGAVPRETRAQAAIRAMELGKQLQDHAVTREWALRFVREYADTDAAVAHEAAMAYIWAGYKAEPDKTKRRERAVELLNYNQLPARTLAKIHADIAELDRQVRDYGPSRQRALQVLREFPAADAETMLIAAMCYLWAADGEERKGEARIQRINEMLAFEHLPAAVTSRLYAELAECERQDLSSKPAEVRAETSARLITHLLDSLQTQHGDQVEDEDYLREKMMRLIPEALVCHPETAELLAAPPLSSRIAQFLAQPHTQPYQWIGAIELRQALSQYEVVPLDEQLRLACLNDALALRSCLTANDPGDVEALAWANEIIARNLREVAGADAVKEFALASSGPVSPIEASAQQAPDYQLMRFRVQHAGPEVVQELAEAELPIFYEAFAQPSEMNHKNLLDNLNSALDAIAAQWPAQSADSGHVAIKAHASLLSKGDIAAARASLAGSLQDESLSPILQSMAGKWIAIIDDDVVDPETALFAWDAYAVLMEYLDAGNAEIRNRIQQALINCLEGPLAGLSDEAAPTSGTSPLPGTSPLSGIKALSPSLAKYIQGVAYYERGDSFAAKPLFLALKDDPAIPAWQSWEAEYCLILIGMQEEPATDFKPRARAGIESAPSQALRASFRGVLVTLLMNGQEFAAAAAECERIFEKHPDYPYLNSIKASHESCLTQLAGK